MSGARPPKGALWLLRRCVPEDARDAVIGDLEEVFRERLRERGAVRARTWFRLQAISFSMRFLLERIRDRVVTGGVIPSWLDVKLGGRMLVKSPLLTVTGCVAIATAIGINAGYHEFVGDMLGDARFDATARGGVVDKGIVRLVNQDLETGARDPRLLQDLARWRAELETVEDIGAAISLDMSLVGPSGRPFSVDVVETSASAFRITGMVPELGRPLLDTDDGTGAEPVVVLAHAAWQRYLGGDPDVLDSSVRLGERSYRVVGVAPDGFRFPRAVDAWTNFRRDPAAYPPREGPPVLAFGRLAEGRTLEEAQREIEQSGLGASAESPETHERLRPAVSSFATAGALPFEVKWILRIARTLLAMLLVVACANIATLVFARNAGRASEIAVRHALGAGRARIVTQLFVEAMVLALIATGIGLLVADQGLRYGGEIFWEAQRTEPPLWWDPGVSLPTIVYSIVLATLGAGVLGVLPALRVTGRRGIREALQRAGSGGTLAFGRLATLVIVGQIAITVALVPVVMANVVHDVEERFLTVSFPTQDYLTARLLVDSEVQVASTAADRAAGAEGRTISVAGITDNFRLGPALLDRYKEMRDNVAERLRSEPGVRRVALTSRLPGILGQSIPAASLEVDGQPPRDRGWYVRTATAELELFEVVGKEMAAGRGFTVADYGPDQRVAVVNQAFVEQILEGRSAVGRLVRDFRPEGAEEAPWTEIVGVLPDDIAGPASTQAQIYYPLAGAVEYPVRLLVEVDGDPAAFGPRLRALVAEAEPGLIVDEVLLLEDLRRNEFLQHLFWSGILGFVALVTALLATAGVYSLMSFIVSQRTREIGIRTALGAAPGTVVRGVFSRTFVQLGLGVALGIGAVWIFGVEALGLDPGDTLGVVTGGVSAVIVAMGLLGCAVPLRRALRIRPTEALRADG